MNTKNKHGNMPRITLRELRRLRRKLDAAAKNVNPSLMLQVSLLLPENHTSETVDFAYYLIRRLKEVNCRVRISEVLFCNAEACLPGSQRYAVLREMPLATPCILVFPKCEPSSPSILHRWLGRLTRVLKQGGSLAFCAV